MSWRDVTAECEVSEDGEVIMKDGRVFSRCPVGYRLTKISGPLTPHVAFIVEKQE